MRMHVVGKRGDVLVELLDELHVLRTKCRRDLRIRGILAPCDKLPLRMLLQRRRPDMDKRQRRPRQFWSVRGIGVGDVFEVGGWRV